MPAIIVAQAADPLAVYVLAKLVDRQIADGTDSAGKENEWKIIVGALTYNGSISIPAVNHLRGKVISLFHHNPESGHFGALKTAEPVSRDFY